MKPSCYDRELKNDSFRDVMTALGQLPGMHLGLDAAGIVRRIGSAVSNFNIGDRIVTLSPGAFRTLHRAKASSCQLIPEGLTFEEAATIPIVHGTAWYALVKLAGVIARKGQSILIHVATGGVGQAAIQIAQHAGMEVFATVGSDVKRRLLHDNYSIPDDHIFSSRDFSFVEGVKRMTKGRGVDVILNSLSGEALRQTWYCIAPFGYFIEIGSKDILRNSRLDMKPFLQDASFTFFDLKRIAQERPDMLADIMRETFDLQRKGITRPVSPIVTYPVSEVENAFRLMQTGKHQGKIVLSFADEQQTVSVLNQAQEQSLALDPDAAYVLVGGLGGLGRSLSMMLVKNGARKLCFLSRSGAKSLEAQKHIQELQANGVHVLVQHCDVADAKAVQDSVDLCAEKLGGVRGVIQCAMVLRDKLFRNMMHQDWIECIQPKVHGTWNLHQSLQDVDFFVILSSFAAIFGNRGQSNYAAAGAYEDAIAHFRRARGLHAVTIDVGIMRDVGVLAEQGMLDSLRDWEVPYGLCENDLSNIVKLAIAGDVSGTIPPQIVTGLATGGSAMAAGIDMPWYLDDAKFSIMARIGLGKSAGGVSEQSISVQAQLPKAKSKADAADIVKEALVARVAKMLQTTTDEIDTDRSLYSYGVDSLIAIELVNWALKECKSRITVFDVMAAVPVYATAKKVALNSSLFSAI
jgi:NADPH:quinone reductase-like Zn-dependent oxidoreductase/NADP-dependent 3-hydroxy acid dehydrogenase YdfG/aryl carrier-like protein